MILLVTNRGDLTTDFVVEALRRRGANFVRLNTEDLLREWRVTWTTSGWNAIDDQGRRIDSRRIASIYYRRPRAPHPVDGTAPEAAYFVVQEAAALLRGLYAQTVCDWISSPKALAAAEDKLGQLHAAQRLGFTIPRTIVTNDPREARAFLDSVEHAIAKPLSSGRLSEDPPLRGYTTEIACDDDLTPIALCPHLMQERIPKVADLRITVVDKRIFACRIASQTNPQTSLDWRIANELGIDLNHELVTLPAEISERCVTLVRDLGLRFGAIDVVERTDGYTFLEINPNGQWAWIEQRTHAPISDALADALLGETRPKPFLETEASGKPMIRVLR